MKRVLVLLAHPDPGSSAVNLPMQRVAESLDGMTVVDLYACYPRYKVNVHQEQQRLLEHDVLVLQFPLLWYSTPPLLKEWQDLVLEFGFAHGDGGSELAGKTLLLAVSAGDVEESYQPGGANRFSMRTLLTPLEQTAHKCQMVYLPPLVLFASLRTAEDDDLAAHLTTWQEILIALRDNTLDVERALQQDLMLNPGPPINNGVRGMLS